MKKFITVLMISMFIVFAFGFTALAGDHANIDLGEFWEVDKSLYTWKINTALGGATNLPDVVLGATGGNSSITNNNTEILKAVENTTFVKPNNLIMAFSDGFGFNDVVVTEHFTGDLIMNDLPYKGSSKTASLNEANGKANIVTDSSAGGTALSCGYKTIYSYHGIDKDKNKIPCISELLREKYGKIIGVLTNDWAYDSSPAAFGGAHCTRPESSQTMKDVITFGPDLLVGTGVGDYSNIKSAAAEQNAVFVEGWSKAEANFDANKLWVELPQIKDESGFSKDNAGDTVNVYDYFDYATYKKYDDPTISMMVSFGLTWLQNKSLANNDVGFFMFFENTGTDMAGHANEIEWEIVETRATNEMISICVKFACENPDTMVVHTADHETGNVMLKSGWEDDISKVKFTTSGHSKQDVAVYAVGYADYGKLFNRMGMYNCQVGKLLGYVMGLENYGMPDDEYPDYSIKYVIENGDWPPVETTDSPADATPTPAADEKAISGSVLGVIAKDAASELSFTLPEVVIAAHGMGNLDLKVPASAKHIVLKGVGGEIITEQDFDREMNYNAAEDIYSISFKSTSDVNKMNVTITGEFAKGDEIIIDNLGYGSTSVKFDGYDVSGLEDLGDKTYVAVHDAAEAGTLPADTTTPTQEPAPASGGLSPAVIAVICVSAVVVIGAIVAMVVAGKKK